MEHIIREDYLVEAMEIVELLCDLLLARFGLIEKMTYVLHLQYHHCFSRDSGANERKEIVVEFNLTSELGILSVL